MATTTQLRADIDKLKKAIASKFTPKSAKPKLEAQLKRVEKELADKKSGKTTTSTTASTKATFKSLKDLVRRTKELSIYKGSSESNLQNDAERKALPSSAVKGRRVSQGLRSNQYGDKGSNKGHIYYEYRKNRIDVKQPKSKQRYPILEDGGYTSKKELNEDYKRIIQAPKQKNDFEKSEKSYVGKIVTIKLPTQVNSFKMKVKNEYANMVSGSGTNGGIYDKKYIISKEDGGMMAKGGEVLDTFKSSNNISNREIELKLIKSKDSYDIYRYHSNGERTYVGSAKDEKTARNIFNQEIVYYTEKFSNGGMMAKGGEAGDIKIGTPLTENNIDGAIIMNIEHPEWGTWKVLRKYDDRIWEIRSNRSTTTLFLSEFKYWKRINYSQGGMAEMGMEMPNGGGIQSSTHKLHR
jgi:hypothetical protein